eukprot:g3340.t1
MFTNGGLLSDNNTSEEDEDGSSSSKGETVKSVEILRNFYEKLRMCTNREEGGSKIGALKSMVAFVRELPHAQLQVVAGALFMLARDAPFGEIRKSFSNLLEDLKVNYHRSMPSIVSAFFAFNPEGLKRDEEDEELVRDVFEKSFLAHFRVPNLYKVLSWHPSYLDRYEALRESLVCGEGPLNVPWRHYIAIIAASRHRCRYITFSTSRAGALLLLATESDVATRSGFNRTASSSTMDERLAPSPDRSSPQSLGQALRRTMSSL